MVGLPSWVNLLVSLFSYSGEMIHLQSACYHFRVGSRMASKLRFLGGLLRSHTTFIFTLFCDLNSVSGIHPVVNSAVAFSNQNKLL
jgi:hypothetical protein